MLLSRSLLFLFLELYVFSGKYRRICLIVILVSLRCTDRFKQSETARVFSVMNGWSMHVYLLDYSLLNI